MLPTVPEEPHAPDAVLRLPLHDTQEPELSIVIPALNESLTIELFVDWCKEGLAHADVVGEILIVDSSVDKTAELAVARGARVLRVPKRGLGRAYIDALPFVRGRYVLMGDSDCTYDFRELGPFVAKLREGSELVMGSRFLGSIEDGAMPALHRYFGTPLTTWILNVVFGSHFTDIHCGMRGLTRDALTRMALTSQSWEYASEMIVKSVHMGLRTAEVPIHFLKDRGGRESHHKRAGWRSPWEAGWTNLRATFVHGAAFFLYRPGIAMALVGLALTVPLALGPVKVGAFTASLPCMLAGLTLTTLGLECAYLGIVAKVLVDYRGLVTATYLARFAYTRTVVGAALVSLLGAGLAALAASGTARAIPATHLAAIAALLLIAGFTTFTFVLVLHSITLATWRARPG